MRRVSIIIVAFAFSALLALVTLPIHAQDSKGKFLQVANAIPSLRLANTTSQRSRMDHKAETLRLCGPQSTSRSYSSSLLLM